MGINFILPLIAGIVMTVILGSQVAPNYIEQMKIAKVENRTISNQNSIKDAIVRYIKLNGKVPKNLDDLKKSGLLKDYHESNLFGGEYKFELVKLPDGSYNGTLKIFTTINDSNASKYFSNSFKFPNKPTCVETNDDETCKDNLWETFYLLDNDTFDSIPKPPKVGSIEWADENYTTDNLGKKLEEGQELENGYIDYVKKDDKIIEYIYDKDKDEWVKGEESTFEENKYVAGIVSPERLEDIKIKEILPIIYNNFSNYFDLAYDAYGSAPNYHDFRVGVIILKNLEYIDLRIKLLQKVFPNIPSFNLKGTNLFFEPKWRYALGDIKLPTFESFNPKFLDTIKQYIEKELGL